MAANAWRSLGTLILTIILSLMLAASLGFGIYFVWNLEQRIRGDVTETACIPSVPTATTCYAQPIKLTGEPTVALAVNPAGTLLASSGRHAIQLWDLASGRLIRSFPAHANWITDLSFSPTGQTLASSSLDQTVKLWNVSTGSLEWVLPAGRMTTLAFSPDGQVLAAGSRLERWYDGSPLPQGIHRWEVATGRSLPTLGTNSVSSLTFSPDGQWLASGSDKTELWDLQTEQVHSTLNSGVVTSLVFSPDSQLLITGSSRTKFWQPDSGTLLKNLGTSASNLLISPDGQFFVTASGGIIRFWTLEDVPQDDLTIQNKVISALRGSDYSSLNLRFGLQGRVLIAGSSDGIQLWRQTIRSTT